MLNNQPRTVEDLWSPASPRRAELPTAHKCSGCRERMIPITREMCHQCAPKQLDRPAIARPAPAYVRVPGSRIEKTQISSVAGVMESLGLLRQRSSDGSRA